MALKIWLPLDGSLENKGVSNISFTNSAASYITVNTAGKIGSCYAFNSSANNNGIYSADNGFMANYINNKSWSICAWIKTSSTDTCIISLSFGLRMFAGNSTYISLYNSSRTVNCTSSVAVKDGNWHHVAATYNVSTNEIKFYVDGVNTGNATYTSGYTYASSWANGIFIGKDPNNSTVSDHYLYKGSMNDVRIYGDECLSAAEVKEIAQGLVLHYKLDFIPYNFSTNTVTSFTNFTIGQYYYTIFSINTTDFIAQTGATNGDKFTFSVDINATSGTKQLAARVQHFNSSSDRNSVIGNYIPAGQSGRSSITFTLNTAYTRLNFLITNGNSGSATANSTEQYKCIRIEKGNVHTGYIQTGIIPYIQDSSGYGHNGTITGNISIASNSGRYSNNTYIPSGNTDYITTPTLQLPGDAITMNFWFKSSNKSPGSSYHMPFEGAASSNQSYEMSIYSTGYLRGGLVVGGSRKVDNCTSTKLTDGSWHMCSMTYDGSTIKRYVDGVMEKSTSATGTLVTSSYFVLGHYGTNTSYYTKEAYISDVRLYVTALSADDILALYHTGAKIDNLGNLHTFEATETQSNIIFKIDSARGAKVFQNGLSSYTQANCQVTLTDNGYRIYRPPNLSNQANGGSNNMWGGLKLVNQTTDTVAAYDANRDNNWNLQQGHTYLFAFHAKGQSSNGTTFSWTNNMGWGGGGVSPSPTQLVNDGIPADFQGEKDCIYIFTIEDTITKNCTSAYSSYSAGTTYLSYRHLTFGWSYTNTGTLGTDIYLTNFRLYDITNIAGKIKKNGQASFSDFVENNSIARILKNAEFLTNNLIEL